MAKKYITPTCVVVEIYKSDVIVTSFRGLSSNAELNYGGGSGGAARAADRWFDEEDAGY